MRYFLFIILFTCSLAVSAQTASIEHLAAFMLGSFDSKDQADRDTAYFNVRLKMDRIWHKKHDGYWMYVEQALASTPDKPYRQRVYRLEQKGPNNFLSHVYELSNPEEFIGAGGEKKRFKNLSPDQLALMEGCSINLVYDNKKGIYIGGTAELCHNDWNGAYVASSEVEISANKLVSWDRGWDSQGQQVWGATKGGYEFVKR